MDNDFERFHCRFEPKKITVISGESILDEAISSLDKDNENQII